EARLRVGELLARHDHTLLEQIGLRTLRLGTIDDFRFRRRTPLQRLLDRHRLIDQAERQLGGLAENFEQLLRIAEAGHLHQDAVVSLALDGWFDQAHRIHAPPENFDRLIDGLTDAFKQRGFRGGEPDRPAADILDVDRARTGAADESAERLRQFPELGQPLLQIALANDRLDRIASDHGSAGETDARLAQDAADIVL